MSSLDRFAEGLKDPQAAKTVAYCDHCGSEIYEGGTKVMSKVTDFEVFCDKDCLLESIGACVQEA